MAYVALPDITFQLVDVNGNPAVGHTVTSYLYNTTTLSSLYSDSAGTALPNPFTLNSRGQPQTAGNAACMVYADTTVTQGYKLVQKDADGAVVKTYVGPIFPPVSGAWNTTDIDGYADSMSALVSGSWAGYTKVNVASFHGGWAATTAGPKGRSMWHHDGTTGGTPTTNTTAAIQAAMATGKVISADGKGWVLDRGQQITDLMFGAKADDSTDDTNAINSAILYNLSNNITTSHTGPNPLVYLPPVGPRKATTINVYSHSGIIGERPMSGHSSSAPNLSYVSEIRQISGTNASLIVIDSTENGNTSLSDITLKYLTLRGAWTGPGDATNTTGHAIDCGDNYFIQGCDISQLNIEYFPGSAIYGTTIPLPGIISDVWGRYIGGSVLNFDLVAVRTSHMCVFDKIQGDFVVGPLINIDGGAIVAAAGSWAGNTFLFSNIKHEIDSSASSTTAYSPDTIVLTDLDRAAVTMLNVNVITNNGGAGTPATNALLRLEGTTIPHVDWIGCRMGSSNAVSDYVIDDNVRGVTVSKDYRSGSYNGKHFVDDGTHNSGDVVYQSRQVTSSGVADTYPRFKRLASGKMQWGPGTGDVDAALGYVATDTIGLDQGDSFRIPKAADAAAGQVTSTLQMRDANNQVYYLWVDTTGDLKIATSKPANELTGGTVVGTQT